MYFIRNIATPVISETMTKLGLTDTVARLNCFSALHTTSPSDTDVQKIKRVIVFEMSVITIKNAKICFFM